MTVLGPSCYTNSIENTKTNKYGKLHTVNLAVNKKGPTDTTYQGGFSPISRVYQIYREVNLFISLSFKC